MIRNCLPTAYFILSITIILLMNAILPPFAAPDEFAHIFHAESLSSGQLIPKPGPDRMIGARVNSSMLELLHVLGPTAGDGAPMPADAARKTEQLSWADTSSFTGFPNSGQYGPALYLPQAAGLAAARSLGLSVIKSYDLARLLSALTAVGIASVAIANASRGAFVLAVVLTSPMFLFLATSLSQDGLLVAVSALFAALVGKPQPPVSSVRNWAAWFCALSMAMARPPYALLAALLVRGRDNRSLVSWLSAPDGPIAPLAVVGLTIGWLAAVGALQQPDFAADHRVNSAAQLAGLLHHPSLVFSVIHGTFAEHHELMWKAHEAIARVNVPLPLWIYTGGATALVLAAATCLIEEPGRATIHRMTAVIVFALSIGAIYAAMYLTWTPVGLNFVEGVQGRYFLPYLVGLPLVIPFLTRSAGVGRRRMPVLERIGMVAGYAGWGLMIAVIAKTLLVFHAIYGGAF